MRSENEIRKALERVEQVDGFFGYSAKDILDDAIEELLALRRRLEDRDAIAEIIWEKKPGYSHELADAIIKYLEG